MTQGRLMVMVVVVLLMVVAMLFLQVVAFIL